MIQFFKTKKYPSFQEQQQKLKIIQPLKRLKNKNQPLKTKKYPSFQQQQTFLKNHPTFQTFQNQTKKIIKN